jgi:hypothetical protein
MVDKKGKKKDEYRRTAAEGRKNRKEKKEKKKKITK